MKKIRINELARELEVKAHEILDRLPELGVTEKKTHSSSIDEDVALKLRKLYGFPVPDDDGAESSAVEAEPREAEPTAPAARESEPPAEETSAPAVKPEAPRGPVPVAAEAEPPATERPAE